MIITLLFGLALMLIYNGAPLVLNARARLAEGFEFVGLNFLQQLISCNICSSFWIGILTYLVYPYVPAFLEYAIYLSAIVILIEYLKYTFVDETTF